MKLYSRVTLHLLLILLCSPVSALELNGAVIPIKLKGTYAKRQIEPQTCIKTVSEYIAKQEAISKEGVSDKEARNNRIKKTEPSNLAPTQLLAICHIELEHFQESLALLMPLLKNPSVTPDEIRTMIIIATEIPASERPQLGNDTLINMMQSSLEVLPKKNNIDLINQLNLAIAQLAITEHQYQLANQALNKVKKNITNPKSSKLNAWLNYFYGHYYNEVNQQQLAVFHLRQANRMADKLQVIKLSSLVKESLASLYQQKHRYRRAIDFASQRVELLLPTESYVQQAASLIDLAVLKRQNQEFNQSFIYLFNALELIEKKHKFWLAQTYLELGKSYAKTPYDVRKNAEFAQKYLQNARLHFKNLNKLEQETESILLLAQLNIRNNDTSLAILQLEHVLELAKNDFPALSVQAFELLALSYELAGDHQQANFHFKNFHSIQNTIKERQFVLQQLKIDEQFHLIEQTQQQIELETKNNQLLLRNNRFQSLSYSALGLFLLTIFVIIYIHNLNIRLKRINANLKDKIQHHPRTALPLHPLQLHGGYLKLKYHDEPLFYALVHVPFLSNLNESKGLFNAEKVEQELGKTLQAYFQEETQISQVKDNQLLFIAKQTQYAKAENFADELTQFFILFAQQHGLEAQIASGIVAFPFLNNVRRAVAPERMLNLTSLALFGACQLREEADQSSWLELYAIDKIQPAFFDGDLWILGQAAIDKGIVKIKSSHPAHTILWPALNH